MVWQKWVNNIPTQSNNNDMISKYLLTSFNKINVILIKLMQLKTKKKENDYL